MKQVYVSRVIEAPIDAVWRVVGDFNGLPAWVPNIVESKIEDERGPTSIGCVRSFRLADGAQVRERLLSMSTLDHAFTYNFETPAFPVTNYLASMRLLPITDREWTFAEWRATFDQPPDSRDDYEKIIANQVFAPALDSLNEKFRAGEFG